jgi:hypothetical protein
VTDGVGVTALGRPYMGRMRSLAGDEHTLILIGAMCVPRQFEATGRFVL